jgi:hypothetical protein
LFSIQTNSPTTANSSRSNTELFSFMISGTSYSPSKAFIEFARDFFESLAKNDYGAALGGLDARGKQWNRQKLASSIGAATAGQEAFYLHRNHPVGFSDTHGNWARCLFITASSSSGRKVG